LAGLLLASVFSLAFPLPAVKADVGDVIKHFDSFQMYAPAKFQLEFEFTRNRQATCNPVGFSTEITCNTGTNKLYFEGLENDTYHVVFTALYDLPIQQNVTLTMQSGSLPPIKETIPMNGQTIFIDWVGIQVVLEPRIPTREEYGDYVLQGLVAQQKANQAEIAQLRTGFSVLTVVVLLMGIAIITIQTAFGRRIIARLRGGV
jgi:hypothetical protein